MSSLMIEELTYQPDSSVLFEQFLDWELAVYLDSSAPFSRLGRYDIFSAQPDHIVKCKNISSVITNTYDVNLNYFQEIKEAINHYTPAPRKTDEVDPLPFIGGALGYFGYDLGHQLEQLPEIADRDIDSPDAMVGIYSWAVIVDHHLHRTLLVCHPSAKPGMIREVRSKLNSSIRSTKNQFKLLSPFSSNFSRDQYAAAFETIQNYIAAGDCYQINLAQRFSSTFEGHPWHAYCALRSVAQAPFSAFINDSGNQHAILSLSPERFILNRGDRVTTSPIKGTIARGSNPAQDRELALQLLASAKDRAENLMIVDLLRNDLGKSCIPGSIQVQELFALQSFETVHHLVSTINGQLQPSVHAVDLLASCFPGGSITGAPKVRAMEIIEELEPHRRSAYCGAIGYISCDGQMDTNIAIRTMVCDRQNIHCWAGGGIVADSQCDSEYQECLTKVGKLIGRLESLN